MADKAAGPNYGYDLFLLHSLSVAVKSGYLVCYIISMKTVTLTFSIKIRANQQTIFDYVSDWEKQSDWILFTTVKQLSNAGQRQDAILLAETKLGPIKFVDTMAVTDWQPFVRIVVEHTGRIILGKGVFSVRKISDDSCEFTWEEITPVPFGLIGQVGLVILRPVIKLLFNSSLKRLKANLEVSKQV